MFVEFRFAARALSTWRGGLVVAAVTLAIGIGAATSLYALAGVLLADFPGVPRPDRVARVYAASRSLGVERAPVALAEFDNTLSRATAFAASGAYAAADAIAGRGVEARPVKAAFASPGFFRALGVPALRGRVFSDSDVASGAAVVVVSHQFWKREPTSNGDRVFVDGVARTVIGVMPPDFSYPFLGVDADVWMPLGPASVSMPPIVTVFARLGDGVTWERAGAELDALARGQAPWTWTAIPLSTDAKTRAVGAYGITLGPAILILLIACVNVSCLLLARGLERERELAVRRALGASRARIVRLLAIDSAMLAAIGGTLGAGLAVVILRAVSASLSGVQPGLGAQLPAGAGLLPAALMVSTAACLIFGLVPVVRLSRRDFLDVLNGRSVVVRTRAGHYGARDLIVFGEVASAVGLMVWTAMLFTLFAELRGVHFSFPADRIVAMRVPSRDAAGAADRVRAVPGVTAVALSSGMLGGGDRVRVETPSGRAVVMSRVPVGAHFLETIGVPMLRGRGFTETDMQGPAGTVIVSETAAQTLAPNGEALGMRLRTNVPGAPPLVVIGISRDAVHHGALSRAGLVPAEVYVPFDPHAPEAVVLARLGIDPHGAVQAITAAAGSEPGSRPARAVVLSDEFAGRQRDATAVTANLLGAFAVLTLLLAASGVFAIVHQSVAQRTREFGIRMAIGARPVRLLGMVVAREGQLLAAALAVGLGFSLALTRALFEELTTLNAALPGMALAALVTCAAVAAVAFALASWRIARLQPAAILRRP